MSGLWDSVPSEEKNPLKDLVFDYTNPIGHDSNFERMLEERTAPYRVSAYLTREQLDFILD